MLPTLLDILKANGSDALVGLVDETIQAVPEIKLVAARTIRGLAYKTLVRTALGSTTGSFRNANSGTAPIKHTYENRQVETFILSPRFEADKAVADRSEDGPQVYIATENSGIMQGEMQGLGKQFYYGAGNNALGHPGLINAYDAINMMVDAGGTTAATGSSVWFVKFGPQGVQWVWGANGEFAMSPVRVESLIDPADATKKFPGYVSDMSAYPGLQVGSLQAVCRIKKLTADAGKGLTDAMISEALSKFPTGTSPDAVFMNRRSLLQLQKSRTPTTQTGSPAPFPTGVVGINGQTIQIAVTDAISSTESLTL